MAEHAWFSDEAALQWNEVPVLPSYGLPEKLDSNAIGLRGRRRPWTVSPTPRPSGGTATLGRIGVTQRLSMSTSVVPMARTSRAISAAHRGRTLMSK